jgi:hypothetical protein
MVIRKSAYLNIFSFRFDVDLLIDLYSQAEPFSFFLSSVELSEMESVTELVALVSHLPGYWSELPTASSSFPDCRPTKYTGPSIYDASLAGQLLSWVYQGIRRASCCTAAS